MSTADKHFLRSSEREEYLEYIFLADLCSFGWSQDRLVEVARAHTDAFGYDLVLGSGRITRHVQLKASVVGGKTRGQKVSLSLAEKQSGCIIWMKIDGDTLQCAEYGWFGGQYGEPLPHLGAKVARHTKGDASGVKNDREGHRIVPWRSFEAIGTIPEIFDRLFGPSLSKSRPALPST